MNEAVNARACIHVCVVGGRECTEVSGPGIGGPFDPSHEAPAPVKY